MSYTFDLDSASWDLVINNNSLQRISGADEVRQRICIALRHILGEYFLNVDHGVPYQQILGSKFGEDTVLILIRNEIMEVPGVLSINKISVNLDKRHIFIQANVLVQDSSENKTVLINEVL